MSGIYKAWHNKSRSQFYKNKIKADLKIQYASKSIQSHRVSSQKNFCLDKSHILLNLMSVLKKKTQTKKKKKISQKNL